MLESSRCVRTISSVVGHVDINGKDEAGHTLLEYAVSSGNFEAVKVLIRHGATMDVLNHNIRVVMGFDEALVQ